MAWKYGNYDYAKTAPALVRELFTLDLGDPNAVANFCDKFQRRQPSYREEGSFPPASEVAFLAKARDLLFATVESVHRGTRAVRVRTLKAHAAHFRPRAGQLDRRAQVVDWIVSFAHEFNPDLGEFEASSTYDTQSGRETWDVFILQLQEIDRAFGDLSRDFVEATFARMHSWKGGRGNVAEPYVAAELALDRGALGAKLELRPVPGRQRQRRETREEALRRISASFRMAWKLVRQRDYDEFERDDDGDRER